MGCGAWSFFVGGVACQVYSGYERDPCVLSSYVYHACVLMDFFDGFSVYSSVKLGP